MLDNIKSEYYPNDSYSNFTGKHAKFFKISYLIRDFKPDLVTSHTVREQWDQPLPLHKL